MLPIGVAIALLVLLLLNYPRALPEEPPSRKARPTCQGASDRPTRSSRAARSAASDSSDAACSNISVSVIAPFAMGTTASRPDVDTISHDATDQGDDGPAALFRQPRDDGH